MKLKGKTKLTFAALIAAVICIVVAAFAGIFGSLGAGVQTASATAAGTSMGNLGTGGSFTSSTLTKLMGQIMGSTTAKSYNQLKAYMDKDTDNARTGTEINAQLSLGGQTWNVVHATEDRGGDVIVTLWLASSSDKQQYATWAYYDISVTYPAAMYSTSYIRSYLTGSSYVANNGDEVLTKGAQNATWKTFITQYGNYMAAPSEMAYQETESAAYYGMSVGTAFYSYPNDAYGTPAVTNWPPNTGGSVLDFSSKPCYSDWQSDKLWLPSYTEVGSNCTNGIWGLNSTICANSDNAWLRSASTSGAGHPYYVSSGGDGASYNYASEKNAVRPALHLNLKKAAAACGLFVEKPLCDPIVTEFSTQQHNVPLPFVPADYDVVLKPAGWDTLANGSGGYIAIPANAAVGTYVISVDTGAGKSWSDGSCGTLDIIVQITAKTLSAPTLSSTSVTYNPTKANTVTITNYANTTVILPTGWTRSNGTVTIPTSILPGQYEIAVTPNAGYMWAGGGTGTVILPIKMDSATATTPSLSKTGTAFSTSSQTFTVGSAALTGVTLSLPVGWTLNSTDKKTVTIPANTAVGSYAITATADKGYVFSDGATVKSYSVAITPATISSITWSSTSTSFAYTGAPVNISASATGAGNLPVIVTGDNVNAGTFTVTAVNVNPNYVFASTLTTTKTITITKQAISAVVWSVANNSGFEYDTQNHAPTASFIASNGQLYSLPVTLKKGGTAATSATDAGAYTATVAAGTYNTNFSLAAESTVNFNVNQREVQIDWGAETFTYSGGNRDLSVVLSVASGLLGSDTLTLTATYKSGDKVNVSDAGFIMEAAISGTSANYKLPSVKTHTYKIAPLPLSGVTAQVQGTYTYNGSIQTPVIALTGGNIVSGDTVSAYVSGGGIDAGTHNATIIGINNPNYLLDGTISVQFTIKPFDIDESQIKWSVSDGDEFTYNGTSFAPSAWFVYNGVTYALTTDLAEAYNASATAYTANVAAGIFQNNFNLVDLNDTTPTGNAASVSFKINKAQITANDVEWSFTEGLKFAPNSDPAVYALFRYNNVAYVLNVSFTDEKGNTVALGGDGSQWKTGNYTATVALGTDGKFDNFELSGTISRTFKMTDSASGTYTVIWEGFNSVVNYNGADQKPGAYIIVDGEKLDVTVTVEKWDGSAWVAANGAKNAGTYRFTATRTGYTLGSDKVECRIDPRVISVDYANLTGLKHGTVQDVTATTSDPVAKAEIDAGILNVAVSGSGHVAGTHVVTATPQNEVQGEWVATGNYVISNATAVQTIGKKVLTVDNIDLKNVFTYDGSIKIPEGKVKVNALTTADQAGGAYLIFEFVYAVNVGTYPVKVLGVSNENYVFSGEITLTINEREISEVKWEGVQNGNAVTYNKQNQAPKPYIEVGGNKIYLEGTLEKYDAANGTWGTVAYAINAGEYRVTVAAVASGTGNYFLGEAVNAFTVGKFELSSVYLTKNVFTYDGNTPDIQVYAIGANNERIYITNAIVLDGLGTTVTSYPDAGTYIVQVKEGVLGSNANYTLNALATTSFVINPQLVNVTFEITGNSWSWKSDVETLPTVTVKANAANAIEVKYGKFGADNTKPTSSNHGLSYSFNITGMTGDGIITVVAASANYQITGASVQTFNVIPADGVAQATFSFDGKVWSDDNQQLVYNSTDGKTISVSGDKDVIISYYKDGVLLENAITTTAGLDAGTYLITVNCPTRELSTNITASNRTFTILPEEVDFSNVKWVINGVEVAGASVQYNGQIYTASLNLGDLATDFEVFYTDGAMKNVGSITTVATVVSKNRNYKAVNVSESYGWTITEVEATVVWNDNGTISAISGDSAEATGGSFFVKAGAAYKVVYKKDGTVLDGAPTEAGEYTAEIVLAIGNDDNVKVNAQSFSFSIGGGEVGGDGNGIQSLWFILPVAIAVIAVAVAIVALISASKKKKVSAADDDGFYDDVTEEDLM